MKEYDVHLSVDCGSRFGNSNPILTDMWKFITVEADSEEDAIELASKQESDEGNNVNYILSCIEVKVIE